MIVCFLLYIGIVSRIFNTDLDFTKYFDVLKLTHAAVCWVGSRLEWPLSCRTQSSGESLSAWEEDWHRLLYVNKQADIFSYTIWNDPYG